MLINDLHKIGWVSSANADLRVDGLFAVVDERGAIAGVALEWIAEPLAIRAQGYSRPGRIAELDGRYKLEGGATVLIDDRPKLGRVSIADALPIAPCAVQPLAVVGESGAVACVALGREAIPFAVWAPSNAFWKRWTCIFTRGDDALARLAAFAGATQTRGCDELDKNLKVAHFVSLNRQTTEGDDFALVVEQAYDESCFSLQRERRGVVDAEREPLFEGVLEDPAFDPGAPRYNSTFHTKPLGLEAHNNNTDGDSIL